MGRTIWFAIVVMVFVLCWGTIILGVGSISVVQSQLAVNTSLWQLGPEYQLSAGTHVLHRLATPKPHPA